MPTLACTAPYQNLTDRPYPPVTTQSASSKSIELGRPASARSRADSNVHLTVVAPNVRLPSDHYYQNRVQHDHGDRRQHDGCLSRQAVFHFQAIGRSRRQLPSPSPLMRWFAWPSSLPQLAAHPAVEHKAIPGHQTTLGQRSVVADGDRASLFDSRPLHAIVTEAESPQ